MKRLSLAILYGCLTVAAVLGGVATLVWAAQSRGSSVIYTATDIATMPVGTTFTAQILNALGTFTASGSLTANGVAAFNGAAAFNSTGTFNSAVAFNGVLSPPSISANQNDYNPATLATANVLRLTSSVPVDITGLATGTAGRSLRVFNIGSQPITLKTGPTASVDANEFSLAVDHVLTANSFVLLQYDGASLRWRGISGGVVNLTSLRVPQNLTATATIAHAGRRDILEIVQISSAGGPLENTAATRIAAGLDGQIIFLQGTSATNTYSLPDGNGVKWATGSPVVFDDRTSRVLQYSTAITAWRELVTFTGGTGGGGGGTAASTSFNPTGTIASGNVQTAIAEAASEAVQTSAVGANNGVAPLNATGNVPWDRVDTPFTHPDLTVHSQIDAATHEATSIAIQNSAAGNLLLNGTGNPRITGCTSGTNGIELTLVGLSTTKTVTIGTGNFVLLAGNTGSVTIGIPPGGTSAKFRCNGSTTTWEQILVPSLQQVVNVNPVIAMYTCGDARNEIKDGGGGNKIEDCLDGTGQPVRRAYCGGGDCAFSNVTNLALVQSGAKPTCNSAIAASKTPFWATIAPGTATLIQVCIKDASDIYSWTTLGGSGSIIDRSVRVSRTASQSIPNATNEVVVFDTEVCSSCYDTDNMHNSSTNPTRITFTTAGKYLVTCRVRLDFSAGGTLRDLYVQKNGTTLIADDRLPPSAVPVVLKVVVQYNFAATDYIELFVTQNSGGALSLHQDGDRFPFCEAQRMN